ncbi:hypothetical protein SUGI_1068970 [Cryptomeria japonica]|nr:hypothetical protein SUGI_1068970 [Cryptomeria japonica]
MKNPPRVANGRECDQENNRESKIKNPRRPVQTQSAPKASLSKGKIALLPPKPLTAGLGSIRDPNSDLVNVLEINENMVKRIQQSCKAFGVFARWEGLGISSKAIVDWFMLSFNWIVSIAILSKGFLYIDCGNSRHKKELLTGKSPTFKGFDFCFLDWIPDFNPNNMQSLKIDRLVLIPNLPIKLMDIEIIRKIGNHIGKFVEISDRYRKYANCVMIINMDISVKTLKPIEIKSGVSSFLIYPKFFKGILDLDPASTPILPPSKLRSNRIPGVDISFNLEKGGFVVDEIPLPSRHIEETKDVEDIEEGEFIINKGHEDCTILLGISIEDEGLNMDMIVEMENLKSSDSPKGSPSDQVGARGKGPVF